MYPEPSVLLGKLDLAFPLIGFYDAPEAEPFAPLVRPGRGRACVFAYVKSWQAGKTLHLTAERFGCGGAGHWLCGAETRSREDFLRFLVDDEALKASHDLMRQWLDHHQGYRQTHPHLLRGHSAHVAGT